jgi:hypothetical protein
VVKSDGLSGETLENLVPISTTHGTGKSPFSTLSIYDDQQECRTVDELDGIVNNRDRMLIEFLLIHDRLRSRDHRLKIAELVEEYSLMLVAKKRFDLCFDLYQYLFDFEKQADDDPSLHLFIWLICEMLSSDHRLPIDRFLQAANLVFKPSYQKHSGQSLSNALFMVILATKVTFSSSSGPLSTYRCLYGLSLLRVNNRFDVQQKNVNVYFSSIDICRNFSSTNCHQTSSIVPCHSGDGSRFCDNCGVVACNYHLSEVWNNHNASEYEETPPNSDEDDYEEKLDEWEMNRPDVLCDLCRFDELTAEIEADMYNE